MFQPTKEWVNKVNLSSFELENFFKFVLAWLARKAKQLDATIMFTYSHANTALGLSERVYYLSYFIKWTGRPLETMFCQLYQIQGYHSQRNVRENQNSFEGCGEVREFFNSIGRQVWEC